jgi:hypothetical protein
LLKGLVGMRSKNIAMLGAISALLALALIPAAAFGSKYPIPKPSGGNTSTKGAASKIGSALESKTGKALSKGVSISVKFPAAGTMVCTVNGGGKTIGSGKATSKKAGSKNLKLTFTSAGKKFLTSNAGKKVKVICTFTPKKGKSQTSTTSVKLG